MVIESLELYELIWQAMGVMRKRQGGDLIYFTNIILDYLALTIILSLQNASMTVKNSNNNKVEDLFPIVSQH